MSLSNYQAMQLVRDFFMIYPGLVSITFRQLSPSEIIDLVKSAGLRGIEWGGDIHVPHGDVKRAREVKSITEDAGLIVAAYGSYYRVGHADTGPFEAVLESATTLGAPIIRVWAGTQGTDTADEAYWARVIDDTRHIADMAADAGITIAYEFHAKTLTDTNETARKLLEAVDHEYVKSLWQPPRYSKMDYNLSGIEAVSPWLCGVHVFSWHTQTGERLPLVDGAKVWQRYLKKIAALNRDMFALLEFVVDDSPPRFLKDAETLKDWLADINN